MKPSRGFFAVGIYHTKTEANVGTLWRTANLFGASFIFTVGRRYKKQCSDTMNTPLHVPMFHFSDMEDLGAHRPHDSFLIGVELIETAIMRPRFSHPERAIYLLGAEDHGLPPEVVAQCNRIIKLPGEYSMNVAVAGSIVLYDRWQKSQ